MTAVIVGHDGARWLSHGVDALLEQTRPVQRVVAVDTGSRDRSGTVLTSKLGQAAVFGMDRATGYAAAVRRALQHKAATSPPPASQARGRSEQVEWIWLLHDDCEPAPDALEQLLRGAAETPTAAVLGPKLRDVTDRDVILEAGISLDSVGRRVTSIEPHEVDQGQHDGDRDVLAVSSAGMLVRRDVWDQVGGFDPGMTLFGEDIDLCWRVQAAGFRVRVITDAVVYHALAATRGRRPISVGRRARMLDRRNGLLTLLGNLPTGPMLVSLIGNLAISLVRIVFYVIAKRGTAALDETAAVVSAVGHPVRFARARGRRARGRRAAYGRVRGDLLPGRSVRRALEFFALVLSRSGRADPAAGHSAIDDPADDDSLLIDTGFLQRFVTRPGVLLVLGLIAVSIAAEHRLIGGGPLGGGALLPAWEGSSQLWGEVLQAFHPAGIGSASAAPPYAGFIALLATVLVGKVWLAVDVLLLGCVPLAGATAMLALRRVTRSAPVRVWAAASYALLPVAFGAVAAGRLGSAVGFVLIPVIGLLAGRMMSSETPRLARRAAWATGLVLTVATAFVPVLWLMAVAGAVVAVVIIRISRPAMFVNLAIVALCPLVLLLPWMLQMLKHPSMLLLEAGVQQPGLATRALPARSLLLLSPGGPGLPPYWVSGALLLAGLVALLATRQRVLIASGWCAALLGLGTALWISGLTVTPNGGQPMTPWPGVALAVAAAGLLLAAATGADSMVSSAPSAPSASSGGHKSRRRPAGRRGSAVVLLSLAGLSAPLLAAAFWVMHGVNGPIGPTASEVIPALVPVSGGPGRQLRTLVLTANDGQISYQLLRTDSPQLTYPGLVPVTAAQSALGRAVSVLIAPGGGQAADQSQLLARFDIGFVLLRAPVNAQLASQLDGVAGLTAVSMTPSFDLWRLGTLPSRVSVVEPNGTVVPVDSGPIGISRAAAPAAGGTLELAEPAGGWRASLNGHPLQSVSSPAGSWAQAFRLPAGGGTLTLSRSGLLHDVVAALELLALLVVAILALPGVRTAAELEAAAAASARQADQEDEVRAGQESVLRRAAGAARDGVRGRAAAARGGAGGRSGRPRRDAAEPAGSAQPARPGQPGEPLPRRRAGALGSAPDAAGPLDADLAGAELVSAGGDGAAPAGAGQPRAAWPAGQPPSRFLGGPPEPKRYYDTGELAKMRGDRPDLARPGGSDSRRPPGMSPSGSRFDADLAAPESLSRPRFDPEAGRRAPSPSGGRFDDGLARRPLSPSGARFDDAVDRRPLQESAADEAADRRDSEPPAEPGDRQPSRLRGLLGSRKRSDEVQGRRGRAASAHARGNVPSDLPEGQQRPAARAGRAASRASLRGEPADRGEPGYGDERRYRDERGYREQRGYRDEPNHLDSGYPDSSWGEARHTSRHAEDRASGWPQPSQQQGWPQDYAASPQEGWPDAADALEALPVEEVHHDWPGRGGRSRRGWIAPDDETDGDAW